MATYLVRTPAAGFTGEVGSIHFSDGEAKVEGNLTFVDGQPVLDESTAPVEFRHMLQAGYTVEPADDTLAPADVDGDGTVDELPKRSASREAWREFAIAHGMSPEAAEALGRDQLVEHFTSREISA